MSLTGLYKALWSVGEQMTVANGFKFDWVASEDRIMRETPDQNPVYFISMMDEDDQLNLDEQMNGGGAQTGRMYNMVPVYLYTQTPLYAPNSDEVGEAVYNFNNSAMSELVAYEGLQEAILAFDILGPYGSILCPYLESIKLIRTSKRVNDQANMDNTIRCVSRFEITYTLDRLRA